MTMKSILVMRDGPDATSAMIEAAAAADGHEVTAVDLRSARLAVVVGGDGPDVVIDGCVRRPAIVVHLASTNSLGFASPDLLRRQTSARWAVRAASAREEQGLILSVFEVVRLRGAVIVNGPEAADLSLMPNAVIERLHATEVAVQRRALGERMEMLIAGERVIAHRGGELSGEAESVAHAVARAAGFQFGSVSVGVVSGRRVAVGWTHAPDLLAWPEPSAVAVAVVRSFTDEVPLGTRSTAASGCLFVEELGTTQAR